MDTGELDVSRDENLQYVAQRAKTNVSLEFHLYSGTPHGFTNVSVGISVTDRALENQRVAFNHLLKDLTK
ncbi:hypothetical protein N7462_009339 [Penicillium macrosclerotiorum]|uniref:uncharacterized protein n=1 Tax=Penicillium macrosclerotiorum TaxID=303699 RepID=UPI0025490EBC|nr:uncharacterized protein N7462_009339 [Penicillium macrosclerotiorum]KAJ5673900.1 hypothetical protein N7462_009339 [Penicillium macrosclerotiorum]